jgi:hypothetical protein
VPHEVLARKIRIGCCVPTTDERKHAQGAKGDEKTETRATTALCDSDRVREWGSRGVVYKIPGIDSHQAANTPLTWRDTSESEAMAERSAIAYAAATLGFSGEVFHYGQMSVAEHGR